MHLGAGLLGHAVAGREFFEGGDGVRVVAGETQHARRRRLTQRSRGANGAQLGFEWVRRLGSNRRDDDRGDSDEDTLFLEKKSPKTEAPPKRERERKERELQQA